MTGAALDDAIGRVDYLADDDGSGAVTPHLVNYAYQGLNTFIGQSDGDGVVETTTLDNYGRIADMNYVKSGAKTDHFAYGYDADGNVLYKQNEAPYGSSFSELYSYDSLNRLATFARGTLNSDNTAIATANTERGRLIARLEPGRHRQPDRRHYGWNRNRSYTKQQERTHRRRQSHPWLRPQRQHDHR